MLAFLAQMALGKWETNAQVEIHQTRSVTMHILSAHRKFRCVIDGELHEAFDSDGESTKVRNGVGVDATGRAHFVISEAPVSFGKFARYFRDELETPNALFLDGTVSALWDPARSRVDSGAPLGPLIVAENKGKQS